MSWRIKKRFYVKPGAKIRIHFWSGDAGKDGGAHSAIGRPIKGEFSTSLVTLSVLKELSYEIAGVRSHTGERVYNENTVYWRYAVDICNEGTHGCRFLVEGGGD